MRLLSGRARDRHPQVPGDGEDRRVPGLGVEAQDHDRVRAPAGRRALVADGAEVGGVRVRALPGVGADEQVVLDGLGCLLLGERRPGLGPLHRVEGGGEVRDAGRAHRQCGDGEDPDAGDDPPWEGRARARRTAASGVHGGENASSGTSPAGRTLSRRSARRGPRSRPRSTTRSGRRQAGRRCTTSPAETTSSSVTDAHDERAVGGDVDRLALDLAVGQRHPHGLAERRQRGPVAPCSCSGASVQSSSSGASAPSSARSSTAGRPGARPAPPASRPRPRPRAAAASQPTLSADADDDRGEP